MLLDHRQPDGSPLPPNILAREVKRLQKATRTEGATPMSENDLADFLMTQVGDDFWVSLGFNSRKLEWVGRVCF